MHIKNNNHGLQFPWPEFLLFSIFSLCAAVAWVAIQGGSVTWDAFNHHIYLGRQALHGSRLGHDYFAAGSMSCQYPLGYAPLVAMLDAGWSGTVIFQVLAVMAALFAPACWLIAWCIVPASEASAGILRLAGGSLALSGVLWWKILAQTSNDAISLTLAIWAIALSMLCVDGNCSLSRHRVRLVLFSVAGLLAGLSLVVKLTQFISIIAIFCIVLFTDARWSDRFKYFMCVGVAIFMMVALVGANWAYDSWKFCGSPVYPFMLDVFRDIKLGGV